MISAFSCSLRPITADVFLFTRDSEETPKYKAIFSSVDACGTEPFFHLVSEPLDILSSDITDVGVFPVCIQSLKKFSQNIMFFSIKFNKLGYLYCKNCIKFTKFTKYA